MFSRILGFFFLLLASAAIAFAGDDVPAWLQQDAAIKPPAYEKDVSAVVLRDEQTVTVGSDGRVTTIKTYAVRILNREGRDYAEAAELYLTGTGKVREMHAWLLKPSGSAQKYGKDEGSSC